MVPFGEAGLGATTALARIKRAVAERDEPLVQLVAPVTVAAGALASRVAATWQGADVSGVVTDQVPLAEAFALPTTAFESALRTVTSASGVAVPLAFKELEAASQVADATEAFGSGFFGPMVSLVFAFAACLGTVPSPHPVRALASTNAEAKAT